jgi:hypothetical protein
MGTEADQVHHQAGQVGALDAAAELLARDPRPGLHSSAPGSPTVATPRCSPSSPARRPTAVKAHVSPQRSPAAMLC